MQILYGSCLKKYSDSMRKVFNETKPFVSLANLLQLHVNESMSTVSRNKSKKHNINLSMCVVNYL